MRLSFRRKLTGINENRPAHLRCLCFLELGCSIILTNLGMMPKAHQKQQQHKMGSTQTAGSRHQRSRPLPRGHKTKRISSSLIWRTTPTTAKFHVRCFVALTVPHCFRRWMPRISERVERRHKDASPGFHLYRQIPRTLHLVE